MRLIADVVGKAYGASLEDLHGRSRVRRLVEARERAMTLARRLTSKGYPNLARFFQRDFTTVLFLVKRMEEKCRSNLSLAAELATLEQACITQAWREHVTNT